MRRECHGHSERTAAAPGLFQIGEQRVHHLHDGPRRRRQPGQAQGGAVQDVGGDGGPGGGRAPDRLHHRPLPLPEHVHLAGKSRAETRFRNAPSANLSRADAMFPGNFNPARQELFCFVFFSESCLSEQNRPDGFGNTRSPFQGVAVYRCCVQRLLGALFRASGRRAAPLLFSAVFCCFLLSFVFQRRRTETGFVSNPHSSLVLIPLEQLLPLDSSSIIRKHKS